MLLPTVGLLGGIGLLLMERLPQDLAGNLGGLAQTQLVWLVIGLAILTMLARRRPQRRLAAPLQVHVGGRRRRPAAA